MSPHVAATWVEGFPTPAEQRASEVVAIAASGASAAITGSETGPARSTRNASR
jgi:hypothetical protein